MIGFGGGLSPSEQQQSAMQTRWNRIPLEQRVRLGQLIGGHPALANLPPWYRELLFGKQGPTTGSPTPMLGLKGGRR